MSKAVILTVFRTEKQLQAKIYEARCDKAMLVAFKSNPKHDKVVVELDHLFPGLPPSLLPEVMERVHKRIKFRGFYGQYGAHLKVAAPLGHVLGKAIADALLEAAP